MDRQNALTVRKWLPAVASAAAVETALTTSVVVTPVAVAMTSLVLLAALSVALLWGALGKDAAGRAEMVKSSVGGFVWGSLRAGGCAIE